MCTQCTSALQDCHLSQLLPSTTAVSVLQHHFSWMLLAATLTALVTMIYIATWAVPVSPVHVKHYILRPPLLEPCNLVSCDLPRVLINYSTSPGGISQACRIMDKQNSCQHECCSCKSLKRSCKDTCVSRDAKITSACSFQ